MVSSIHTSPVPNPGAATATGALPRRESPEYSPVEEMDKAPFDFGAGPDEEELQKVREAIIKFRGEMAAVKLPRPDEPNTIYEKALNALKNGPVASAWAGGQLGRKYEQRVAEASAESERMKDPAHVLEKQRERLEARRGKSWPLNAASKAFLDKAATTMHKLQFGPAAEKLLGMAESQYQTELAASASEGRPVNPEVVQRVLYLGDLAKDAIGQYDGLRNDLVEYAGANTGYFLAGTGVAYRNNAAVKKSGEPTDSWNNPRNKAGPWKELGVIEGFNMGARFLIMGGDFKPWGKTWKAPLVELLSGGALTAFVVNAPRMVAKIFPKWKINKHLVTITASIAGGFVGGVVTWAAFASDARGPPKKVGNVTFPPLIWAGVRAMINCVVRYPVPKALDSLMGHMMGVAREPPGMGWVPEMDAARTPAAA